MDPRPTAGNLLSGRYGAGFGGSGQPAKRQWLVQRVIDILTDRRTSGGCRPDFGGHLSNAAAEEMRQRINARLSELLAENPTDSYLLRQRTLLSAAHISTVHSFCLELVRANFQLLDIPADFRLGSQNEIDLLEEDVAVQTIEQNYEDNDGRFSDLVELVSSGRDDKGLQDTLHRLYGFVRSHPFYREWLDEKLLMYDDTIPVGQTVWGQVILQYALDASGVCPVAAAARHQTDAGGCGDGKSLSARLCKRSGAAECPILHPAHRQLGRGLPSAANHPTGAAGKPARL